VATADTGTGRDPGPDAGRGPGRDWTTEDVLAGVDLGGRVALVTGASGGLGLETARALAAHGAHVVMAARDDAKNAAAMQQIRDAHPGASVEALTLDLASLASVRAVTATFLERHGAVHLLVANAGVMCTPFGHTTDGFETQFGTNHLGHFALVSGLTDALIAGAPARVVVLSSAGHTFGDVDLDDPNFERRPYDPFESYGQSKTANVLFAVELDRRLADRGVRAFAVHPGGIRTELGRYMEPHVIAQIGERLAAAAPEHGEFRWKSVPQGAATTVWAATAEELAERGGVYCEDCHVAGPRDDAGAVGGGVRPYALDPRRARLLWELSERLVA
jgi:NAD(P)-dependent dehydrogenase (short-subunit alcohol dehydrogenase family)